MSNVALTLLQCSTGTIEEGGTRRGNKKAHKFAAIVSIKIHPLKRK
jgi:hypothetical protein